MMNNPLRTPSRTPEPSARGATALAIIDAQVNMFAPEHPVESAEALLIRLGALLERGRAARLFTVFVRNCGGPEDPDQHGTPGWEFHPSLQPTEKDLVLDKTTCDTFASTALEDELRRRGITPIVVAGLQSDWCIRETTLGALSRSFEVTLVADGHSTYDGKSRTAAETIEAVSSEFEGRVTLAPAEAVSFT